MTDDTQVSDPRHCIFFVTAFTVDRRALFSTDERLANLRTTLAAVARKHRASVLGYVLLSDHLHLLVALDCTGHLGPFVRDLMQVSASQLLPDHAEVWRSTFESVLICTEDEFYRRLQEVHEHPVRSEISESATEFPHSSAAAWLCGCRDGITDTSVSFEEE